MNELVSLRSELLNLVIETFTVMTICQIKELRKLVDFLEVRQASNWHKKDVVRIIVRLRD